MAFTLRIKFVCLCFFVPDEANGTVHVLMPATCGHNPSAAPVELHLASLVYPFPGGRLDEDGHVAGPADPHVKEFTEMTGWALALGGDEGANPYFPEEVVDVTDNAGQVEPDLLVVARHPAVASHLVLSAGSFEHQESVAKWLYNGRARSIAQQIFWTMQLPGDGLAWSRTRLKPIGARPAAGDIEQLPFIPARDGRVEIEVHHTTRAGFPIPPEPVELPPEVIARHFAAFYTLFRDPPNPELPAYLHDHGVLPRTCMGARGETMFAP